MPSAIDPAQIPGKDIDPDTIESEAGTVRTIAASVRDNGSDVHLAWQGMAGVYSAPESGTLLGLMQPVSSQATAVGDNLDVVSAALIRFAADVRPIKAELESLRTQAESFRAEIAGGVSVRELNPAWVSSRSAYGGTSTLSYSSSSIGGTSTAPAEVPQYRTVTKEWHELQEYVDRNNDLISAVNAQQVALWEAERECANAIRALYGADALRAATSEDDSLAYGLSEIPEGTEMPWGAPVERTEGCGEATATFVFKDFLWEGIAVGGVWGTVEGLGTLVLGYDPATGDWFSGDAYGAAWGNLGLLAASGAMNSALLAPLMWADQGMESFGGGGFLPQEVRDFKATADEAALNTGKALIAWDSWQDDPGTALGESVFNVGTALIPVGGAAVAGVKTASTAASVLTKMTRVVDFVDPAAWAVNGTVRLGGMGLGSLDNLIGKVDGFDSPNLEISSAADSTSALRQLDRWDVDLDTVTARVDDGIPVLEFPGGRIELPAGAFDDAAGGVRVREDGGPVEPTDVREPEAGGNPVSDGDAGTSPVGGGDDGWTRGPEHRGDPIDPDYGTPRPDHGTLDDRFTPPPADGIRSDVAHLVTDPEAPYGRDASGGAYTRAEWEERYVGPDDFPRYPGNDGAVPGSRVEYTDISAFRRDFGGTLDRLGGDRGAFLSPEGIPFEHRALPGGSLDAPYSVFRVADDLPDGMRIEVSRVAEAFGQPGGGIQLRFLFEDEVLSVERLINDHRVLDASYRTAIDGTPAGATFSDLMQPVPGASDVRALHAASLPVEMQRALIRHEYPGMLGINSTRFGADAPGFDVNCTRCVVALDRLFDDAPTAAMPVHTNGAAVSDITRALGLRNGFEVVPGYADIVTRMDALPVGSRGIVLVERHTGIGHVFNVLHDDRGVVFLDAQSGRFATLEDAARLRLLVTHQGTT